MGAIVNQPKKWLQPNGGESYIQEGKYVVKCQSTVAKIFYGFLIYWDIMIIKTHATSEPGHDT